MHIIFLTMSNLQGIAGRGIYTDLMRKFRDEGHQVTIVAPRERRTGEPTSLKKVTASACCMFAPSTCKKPMPSKKA